jgi:hypothetical protein
MRSDLRWAALLGAGLAVAAVAVAPLAGCGARTEPLLTDTMGDSVGAGSHESVLGGDGGAAEDAGDASVGGNVGPCFLCREPLVQECSYCVVQGQESTWICPLPHAAPEARCGTLLEDHTTPKGAHFTCFYCF